MATSASVIAATLDAIATRIASNRAKAVSAKSAVTAADTDLASMPTAYMPFLDDLGTLATANPNDAFIQAAKARGDHLTTEFQALKIVTAAMKSDLTNDAPDTAGQL